MTTQTNQKPVPLSDIRWAYDLVHSAMFYSGLTLDEACEKVEKTFDGTQPEGLFKAVKAYHQHRQTK